MAHVEFRASASVSAARGNKLAGYACLFNSPALIGGEFHERIAPGAFAYSLKSRDILALLHHNEGRVLGRTSSGTLRLREDAKGLRFDLDVDPSTPDGATALGLVARRDLTGMSFGFAVRDEDWEPTSALPIRTLREVVLLEVSIVGRPAYDGTSVALSEAARTSGGPAWQAAAISAAEAKMRARGLV